MLIVFYSSQSNMTARFVEKLGLPSLRLPSKGEQPTVNEPYVLVVPSYGGGNRKSAVPPQIVKFLNIPENREHARGIVGSGSSNYGEHYCIAAKVVATKLQIPLIYMYEILGTPEDVQDLQNIITDMEQE